MPQDIFLNNISSRLEIKDQKALSETLPGLNKLVKSNSSVLNDLKWINKRILSISSGEGVHIDIISEASRLQDEAIEKESADLERRAIVFAKEKLHVDISDGTPVAFKCLQKTILKIRKLARACGNIPIPDIFTYENTVALKESAFIHKTVSNLIDYSNFEPTSHKEGSDVLPVCIEDKEYFELSQKEHRTKEEDSKLLEYSKEIYYNLELIGLRTSFNKLLLKGHFDGLMLEENAFNAQLEKIDNSNQFIRIASKSQSEAKLYKFLQMKSYIKDCIIKVLDKNPEFTTKMIMSIVNMGINKRKDLIYSTWGEDFIKLILSSVGSAVKIKSLQTTVKDGNTLFHKIIGEAKDVLFIEWIIKNISDDEDERLHFMIHNLIENFSASAFRRYSFCLFGSDENHLMQKWVEKTILTKLDNVKDYSKIDKYLLEGFLKFFMARRDLPSMIKILKNISNADQKNELILGAFQFWNDELYRYDHSIVKDRDAQLGEIFNLLSNDRYQAEFIRLTNYRLICDIKTNKERENAISVLLSEIKYNGQYKYFNGLICKARIGELIEGGRQIPPGILKKMVKDNLKNFLDVRIDVLKLFLTSDLFTKEEKIAIINDQRFTLALIKNLDLFKLLNKIGILYECLKAKTTSGNYYDFPLFLSLFREIRKKLNIDLKESTTLVLKSFEGKNEREVIEIMLKSTGSQSAARPIVYDKMMEFYPELEKQLKTMFPGIVEKILERAPKESKRKRNSGKTILASSSSSSSSSMPSFVPESRSSSSSASSSTEESLPSEKGESKRPRKEESEE
ncbi:MAG: hypothetical protein KR126chlam5_01002 [Candidatus Anoxychlamydiales bacterium]|nr:hypothetical protein [Candidatus Anoxychlamydiales bacterium]